MNARPYLVFLVILALLLPIVIVVLQGVSWLLGSMQDAAGAAGVGRLSQACGTVWGLDLIVLLIVSAIQFLSTSGTPPDGPSRNGSDS